MSNIKKFGPSLIVFVQLMAFGVSCDSTKEEIRILVFSKTGGFRHESIGSGIDVLRELGQKKGFIVDTTENASNFNEENLIKYKAVIFLNTTGDILNQEQQKV